MPDIDISTEEVEARAAVMEKYDTTVAGDGVPDLLRAIAQERDHMKRALEPFSKMAGELFARNYDAEDVVLHFRTPEGESVVLDFSDFLVVRDALRSSLVGFFE